MLKSISVEYCGESNDIEVGVEGVAKIVYKDQYNYYEVHYDDGSITRVHGVTFAEIVSDV